MVDERDRAAHELIAEIYASVCSLREAGKDATAIVLPPGYYRVLQEYRGRIGAVRDGLPDYLGQYDLFGIPLYTDNGDRVLIRAKRMKKKQ